MNWSMQTLPITGTLRPAMFTTDRPLMPLGMPSA